jgi:hypothetical protein
MNHRPFASGRAHLVRAAVSLWWVAGLVMAFAIAPALATQPSRNVLVLNSDSNVLPGLAVFNEALVMALRANYGPAVELSNEFLGLDEPRPAGYGEDLVEFLRKKDAETQFDAIVAVRGPAPFYAQQDQFLPGRPSCLPGCASLPAGARTWLYRSSSTGRRSNWRCTSPAHAASS